MQLYHLQTLKICTHKKLRLQKHIQTNRYTVEGLSGEGRGEWE